MDIVLLALAVLPALLLAIYVYNKDTVEKEPVRMLIKAFGFGMLSCLPAVGMETVLMLFDPGMPVVSGLWNGFVVAGFSEELCKLLLLALAVWRSKEFNEYFDGVVYATFVSLGFACFENIGYVFGAGDFVSAMSTGVMRAMLSVPAHFLFGVVMGYYFGLAKFDLAHRRGYICKALIYPALLHGTFDSLLMIPESVGGTLQTTLTVLLFGVFVWFDIRLWKIGLRRLRHLQELSQQQNSCYTGYDNNDTDYDGYNQTPQNPFSSIDWDI